MAITNAGLLGSADLQAGNSAATPYTAPAASGPNPGRVASVTVTFCNTGTTEIKFRLAVTAAASPAAGEWSFYDHPLAGKRSIDITRTVGPGQKVVASSDLANVSCTVNGLEETIG